ncbi:MAG: 3-oxoacyl-ACP reductase [Actinomycetia bacterium]|jgi:NAD(P)-dependent dehydrogenase (short-subunit alcohol dehydrogenase family)|nr:3-oxoacyl-ACP reductase [Actinomycetes bacterium]
MNIALITGAGSGIGRASALALLEAGWTVVLTGRRAGRLRETADLAADGARVLVAAADVTDPASVDALFAMVADRYGRLDLLFNNAGAFTPATPFEELSLQQWRAALDVNLTGVFLCARAAFRLMKDQDPRGGRIINNGSVSAHTPRPHSAPYTATKHGVAGLTKSLSLDGRRYGIACGQIDIGNAATDLTAGFGQGMQQADGSIAAEPLMDVRDVARTVVHMASLPLEANMQSVTILATTMPYVGRG